MKKKTISFNKTGLFSPLICDFVNSDLELKPLVNSFVDLKSIKYSLEKKNEKNRAILSSVIKEQYNNTSFLNLDLSLVYSNVDKLLDKNVYTVTAGHQLNIFLNPLFLIYKIISIISTTNYLNKKYIDSHFIPCFWIATEDHDFQEISSFKLEDSIYRWNLETQDAIGNLESKSLLKILNQIKHILITTSYGKELFKYYNHAYRNNLNYADATRSLLTSLFGDYGLVVVDGNHVRLKELFVSDLKEDILNGFVYDTVSRTNKVLKKKYKPKINSMQSNIFYLSNSIRSKIKLKNNIYFTEGHSQTWSQSELLNEIDKFPENFSPNVFLRTLYQESIMSNILYLGGPSEISYWLQLKNMFDARQIHYPILALRSHFLILSKKISHLKSKLNLESLDLFLDYEEKVKKILYKTSSLKINKKFSNLKKILLNLENEFQSIEGFPINSFYVFQTRFQNEFSRLNSKILKFEKIRNQHLLNKIKLLDSELFPNKSPQERMNSFIPYYIKYGKAFFDSLIKESSIFHNKYTILTEEE